MNNVDINYIINFFSNREWATIIWGFVLFVWSISYPSIRQSVYGVLNVFFQKKLITLIICSYLYLSAWILFLYFIKIWSFEHIKDTLIYILITSIIMVFKALENEKQTFFKDIILQNIKINALISFYLNVYSFSFVMEMIFIPFITFLVALQVFSETLKEKDKTHILTYNFFTNIMVATVLGLLAFSIYKTFKQPEMIFSYSFVKAVFLPFILTLLFIPFLYGLMIYISYEVWFIRLEGSTMGNNNDYKFRRNQILKKCNVNYNKINFISKNLKIFMISSNSEFLDELERLEVIYKSNHLTSKTSQIL